MAGKVSNEKLLFYSLAGALGGLGAWGIAETFMGIQQPYVRDVFMGALVGAFIAAFLASIEALSVSQWRVALRGLRSGALIGAVGGALGLLVGEFAFDILGGLNGRILGWAVLGVVVGWGVGWAARSGARCRNGAIGGALGGALGGLFYQSLTATFPQAMGRAVADVLLGALIGFFIGLVSELLKRAWLMVIRSQSRNAREGREYPLVKPVTVIGRAEESDVGLFGDPGVVGRHALIRREGKVFYLAPAPGAQVLLNRQVISGRQALKSGDRIEVGGTLLLFRDRVGRAGG